MKKGLRLAITFLAMSFAMSIYAQSSKDYTENLVVTVNGETSNPQPATLTVETLENGNINFVLKNFVLATEDSQMPVGNIEIDDIPVTDAGYCKTFSYSGNATIAAGDLPGVEMWLGPLLGPIPMTFNGKLTDNDLYVTIDIDMSSTIGQVIHVVLGEDIDPATSISSVPTSTTKASAIYNISGCRVNAMTRGRVYIVNGKKIMK